VVAVELILEVPRVVGVGTRFEVSWTGTSGSGDFITVAREGSDPSHEIDSTYASLGSPVTLAAPFEAGRYVVRYISGASRQILAESPIEIR
jgi:Ca-activated chloride channel family protein